jgi:hypothetical protein
MHWLMTTHVRCYLRHYRSSGHVWQGRFKAFPTQENEHILIALRYIERNPLRAGLVERAEGIGSGVQPPIPRAAASRRVRARGEITQTSLSALRFRDVLFLHLIPFFTTLISAFPLQAMGGATACLGGVYGPGASGT